MFAEVNFEPTGYGVSGQTEVKRLSIIDNEVYAPGIDGIYKYNLGENKWEPFAMSGWHVVDFKLLGNEILAMAVPQQYTGDHDYRSLIRLYKGDVSGSEFRDITPDEMQYEYHGDWLTYISRMAQNPHSPEGIAVLAHNGISISHDFGDSWDLSSEYSMVYNSHSYLGWHQYINDVIFLTSESNYYSASILRTDNGGASWSMSYPPDAGDNSCHQLEYDINNSNRILASGEGAVWESTDCGLNWLPVEIGPDMCTFYLYNIIQNKEKPSDWYIAGANSRDNIRAVYQSTDNGKTWHPYASVNIKNPGFSGFHDAVICGDYLFLYAYEDIYRLPLTRQSGMRNIPVAPQESDDAIFDLQGHRVTNPQPQHIYQERDQISASIAQMFTAGSIDPQQYEQQYSESPQR